MANCILGPGSFLEATKLIPLLVKGDDGPAFDVVAPSLPNYGFSQGVQKVCFFDLVSPGYIPMMHVMVREDSVWLSMPRPCTR